MWLHGHHAVAAAMGNPDRECQRLLVTRNNLVMFEDLAAGAGIHAEVNDPREIERAAGPGIVHQGVALQARVLPSCLLEDLIKSGKPIVVLDQLTDPHNVGAVLRSAAAFDVGGVIMQDRHSPPLAGTLAKSASGAVDIVPIAQVTNIARTLEDLARADYWRIGLVGDAEKTITQMELGRKVALVLGAEGEGLRRLTRENCDLTARIPMSDAMESLNVSNAAAVVLYALYTAT